MTLYPGEDLVNAADGDIVVVSIQYHMGIFGKSSFME